VTFVEGRIATAEPTKMQDMEDLDVPVLNFDILREYSELYGRPMEASNEQMNGTDIMIALQSIRFRLDETGAVLKSEARVTYKSIAPRCFIFDKPFLIILKLRQAANPYFALWVANPELLVVTKK
jgi:hypothetical protein